MGKEINRMRDKQINIRVTDCEYQVIMKRMEETGFSSLREYIVDAATNGFLIKVDYSDLKSLIYEINKIGTNINQIAYKINSENAVYKSEIEAVQDDVDMIWKIIRAKLYQTP